MKSPLNCRVTKIILKSGVEIKDGKQEMGVSDKTIIPFRTTKYKSKLSPFFLQEDQSDV